MLESKLNMDNRNDKTTLIHKYIIRKLHTKTSKIIIGLIAWVLIIRSLATPTGILFTIYSYTYDPEIHMTPDDFQGPYSKYDNITGSKEMIVPDIVHYVLFNYNDINFISLISMTSVVKIHKPEKLFIHTNNLQIGGRYLNILKWVIQNVPENKTTLEIHYMEQPVTVYGVPLHYVEHASDVARISVLYKFGGIYLDIDQFVLKPLHKYRHFEMSLGWPQGQSLGTQVLIAAKEARFLKLWLLSYQFYVPIRWYYNAGELPTIGILEKHPRLVHRETDLLMTKQIHHDIWGDPSWDKWKDYDTIHLFVRLYPASWLSLDEQHIHTLNCGGGRMANLILYEIEPKINFSLF